MIKTAECVRIGLIWLVNAGLALSCGEEHRAFRILGQPSAPSVSVRAHKRIFKPLGGPPLSMVHDVLYITVWKWTLSRAPRQPLENGDARPSFCVPTPPARSTPARLTREISYRRVGTFFALTFLFRLWKIRRWLEFRRIYARRVVSLNFRVKLGFGDSNFGALNFETFSFGALSLGALNFGAVNSEALNLGALNFETLNCWAFNLEDLNF